MEKERNDNFQRSNPSIEVWEGKLYIGTAKGSGNFISYKPDKYNPQEMEMRKIRRSKRRIINSLLVFGDNSSSSSTLFVGEGDSGSKDLPRMNLEDGKSSLTFQLHLKYEPYAKIMMHIMGRIDTCSDFK